MTNKKECGCKKDVKMSAPKGKQLNTPYNMDHTFHNEHYWDVNRNIDVTIGEGEAYVTSREDMIQNAGFEQHFDRVVKKITDLLKKKNKAYGNTALKPTNIFSKLDASEAICARIDDKLARIKNKGINDKTEDTVDDLIGYFLLLKMSL